jgi:hypothetical protein
MRYYLDERIRIAMNIAEDILNGFPSTGESEFLPKLIDCDRTAIEAFMKFYNWHK